MPCLSPSGTPNLSPVLVPLPSVGTLLSFDASGVVLSGILLGVVSSGGAVCTLRGAAACCGFGCGLRGTSGLPLGSGGAATGMMIALICLGASSGNDPV